MCYSVASRLMDRLKIALVRGDEHLANEILSLLEKLEINGRPMFFANAFAHPKLLVFTNERPFEPQALTWGLIPSWTKSLDDAKKSWNSTVNARGETIFEKPSFRESAKKRRCLIYVDAFFEHHHFKGNTYPFCITLKNGDPLILGGLWSEWVDKSTGEVFTTCSIVTTEGNPLMTKIHNNPKAEGPRMPVILTKENQNEWLIECKTDLDKKHLQDLIKPFDQEQMKAYPVGKLLGKDALGNVEEVEKEVIYPELAGLLD